MIRAALRSLVHEARLFCIALQFLTRVPVPRAVGYEPAWLQASLRHFPLVGAFIGAFATGVLWAALQIWPPTVASALSLVATVWLTGAFLEDGLADTCEGSGGAVSCERALEIMKDSRIGSYGAVALVLALGLTVSIVAALLWMHAASRAAPVALVCRLAYAGDTEHAKANPLGTQIHAAGMLVALGWVTLLGAGLLALVPMMAPTLPAAPLAAAVASALAIGLCARWLRRRLGNFTGDTLGATQQLVELVGLLGWLAVVTA